MASRLIQQGADAETFQLLSGHAELDHVRPYLQVSQWRQEEMFTNVLWRRSLQHNASLETSSHTVGIAQRYLVNFFIDQTCSQL